MIPIFTLWAAFSPSAKRWRTLMAFILMLTLVSDLAGCAGNSSQLKPSLSEAKRPKLAILPFGLGVEITKLSSVKTVTEELSPEQETRLVSQAVQDIRAEARRLLYVRLTAAEQFKVVSLEATDAAVADLELRPDEPLNSEQLTTIRSRLGADLVVTGTVLDYGKVRWQWMAGGVLFDMTWENIVLGLATGWNPIAAIANTGYILATSTPVWFGGGYFFGVAFRPVRVEASAVETQGGDEVWSDMEVAIYARKRLQELPAEERSKKEVQLHVNLATAMEATGDSLLDAEVTMTTLWERRLPVHDVVAF